MPVPDCTPSSCSPPFLLSSRPRARPSLFPSLPPTNRDCDASPSPTQEPYTLEIGTGGYYVGIEPIAFYSDLRNATSFDWVCNQTESTSMSVTPFPSPFPDVRLTGACEELGSSSSRTRRDRSPTRRTTSSARPRRGRARARSPSTGRSSARQARASSMHLPRCLRRSRVKRRLRARMRRRAPCLFFSLLLSLSPALSHRIHPSLLVHKVSHLPLHFSLAPLSHSLARRQASLARSSRPSLSIGALSSRSSFPSTLLSLVDHNGLVPTSFSVPSRL